MGEIWKEIKDTDGLYRINEKGDILSVRNNILLKHIKGKTGYIVVGLNVKGKKRLVKVHRLIAEYFIPNPLNKPIIHHINHKRDDFRKENLMWVTHSENKIHDYEDGTQIGKTNMKGKFGALNPSHKKVMQIDKLGNIVSIIPGISEAARIVNGSASHITKVCLGKLKHHKGYKWQYA
jgi:hypothetical protein